MKVWEEVRLFDPGPPSDPPPGLSYQRRLTFRRASLIEAGVHPATGRRLLGEDGATCGSCGNGVQVMHGAARTPTSS